MTEIIVIAAIAENDIIGKDGDIPWRIKDDFLHFKKLTTGHPCIMSDVTFESLPEQSRPLPNRENIVLTFRKDYHPQGTTIFHSFEDAIKYCNDKQEEKAYITGGSSIYRLGLEVADTLELTRIHKNYEGDVSFPEINFGLFEKASQTKSSGQDTINNEPVEFSFLTYKRKK
jgi:dihydrofolate reductase